MREVLALLHHDFLKQNTVSQGDPALYSFSLHPRINIEIIGCWPSRPEHRWIWRDVPSPCLGDC